jgi:tRNA(fMet)-specific endonuclease VapC
MLDTNVIIKYLSGDKFTKQLIDNASSISISVIVVGELHYGAQKSSRTESNMALFTDFLSNFMIVPIDENIAAAYGEVKNQLHKNGVNIPENDIWIAATAKSLNCNLITFDAHFQLINGLNILPKL